jgi:hypothetical protein
MTPKEKAKELVDKMIVGFMDWTYCIPIDKQGNSTIQSEAKKRALIAVEFSREFITGDLSESFDKFLYIQDIKEEIEKL